MKQIRFFFVMMMLTMSAVVMAQTTTVKGVLMDKTLGEAEPFATVRIYKAGTTANPVAMFLTNESGQFSQEVKGKGNYDVVISSVGKEDLRQTVELGNETTLDMGTLYIKENENMLAGVEIVAQKPLVKMDVDKMSYNVQEDEDSKSNTVLDMLRKVPMVTVDGQDNITVNGSSSFKVYVDGMPNVMFSSNPSMVFKSMPATAVKSIEVMTNPGAKYDAEGAAGVLNIVMNKQEMGQGAAAQSMNGYNGTVRASAGNKQLGGSAFISGQQGKLSYSANVMTSYNKPGSTTTEMEQTQTIDNSQSTIDNSQLMTSSNDVKTPFTMGSLTLGYQIDEMSAVNATAQINSMSMKSTGTSTTTVSPTYSYDSNTDMKNSRTSFSGSIDYQRFFNKEHTQSLALTSQLNYSPATTEMTNNFGSLGEARYSENEDKTTNHIFQLDYTMPIATGQSLNFGGKLQLHDATSDSKYYLNNVYDAGSSSEYEYKNSILAGYGEYVGNWNKLGVKAGLRYEYTWQDVEYHLGNGDDFSTSYGSLVPTASLQYNLGMGSNLGLTYNMRISRPGISYLNPYVDKTNPIALTYGNPDLDVETAHNLSLVYNMFTSKLMVNLNLHHNFVDNGISQYSFYDSDNLLNTTYGNVVERHQTGLNAYVNYLLTKDTRLFLNGSLNYTDLRSDALNQSNGGWTANAMLGLQQTLPWDLKLSAFAITSTKSYTLQGWSSGFNMLTASLSKSLLNDKLNLSVSGLIGLNDGGNVNMETYSSGKDFASKTNITVPICGVTFTVSYTFGNSKMATKQHTSRVQNDFIEQQSQGEMLNSVSSGSTETR